MRRVVAAVLACLLWTGAAAAQDWIAQGSPAEGWTGATACVPGGTGGTVTALCLSLGCTTGRGPSATLSLSEVPPATEAAVTILVDGHLAGVLGFRPDASGITYEAPLDEQDGLVEALRQGSSAEIRVEVPGQPQMIHPLSLKGSGAAIDAAFSQCPVQGQEASAEAAPVPEPFTGDFEPRSSADPEAEAIAENEAYCSGGAAEVEPGFARRADVDGDGKPDLLLDYLGLLCDGGRAYCGTGGCTQEVWLAQPDGSFRLLVSSLIEEVVVEAPGRLRFRLDGGECGLSGAEVCDRTFAVRDGRLVPKP